ncbi:MAG: hypothetical protein O6826_00040, partial [Acidobacteria bacterium]|nr:hypothetical protein [Acidobacteriota bacterium]
SSSVSQSSSMECGGPPRRLVRASSLRMRHVLLEAIILEFSLRVFREVKIEAAQALRPQA